MLVTDESLYDGIVLTPDEWAHSFGPDDTEDTFTFRGDHRVQLRVALSGNRAEDAVGSWVMNRNQIPDETLRRCYVEALVSGVRAWRGVLVQRGHRCAAIPCPERVYVDGVLKYRITDLMYALFGIVSGAAKDVYENHAWPTSLLDALNATQIDSIEKMSHGLTGSPVIHE